jgi:hypothetical protein
MRTDPLPASPEAIAENNETLPDPKRFLPEPLDMLTEPPLVSAFDAPALIMASEPRPKVVEDTVKDIEPVSL